MREVRINLQSNGRHLLYGVELLNGWGYQRLRGRATRRRKHLLVVIWW